MASVDELSSAAEETPAQSRRLGLLLAMAMFVLVVDTSLMNVSISAVIRDLDATASGVQAAIALEALVSAAFILIGGKVGDLIGRKRAYALGLIGYATGAVAMTSAGPADRAPRPPPRRVAGAAQLLPHAPIARGGDRARLRSLRWASLR